MGINYTEFRDSIKGMISKKDKILELNKFYLVIRNRKKIIIYPKVKEIQIEDFINLREHIETYENICLQYIPEEFYKTLKLYCKSNNIEIRNKFGLNLLTAKFDKEYFDLSGKDFIELRETINNIVKHNKVMYTENLDKDSERIIEEIELMINEWNNSVGMKYRRTNHSGYDKNFFRQEFIKNREQYYSLFFYEPQNKKLLGYSIISKNFIKNENIKNYSYLLRKTLTNEKIRNLTLYVDYVSFKNIFNLNNEKEYNINWGASKGTLLKYKKKFPIKQEEKVFFISFKAKELFK